MNVIMDRGKLQAKAQYESIAALVAALECDTASDDAALYNLYRHPLSVEVRSGWESSGATLTAVEYRILLCWGGPAVQIIGALDKHKTPTSAILQYQDWGTPWMDYIDGDYEEREEREKILITYASQFYFGDLAG